MINNFKSIARFFPHRLLWLSLLLFIPSCLNEEVCSEIETVPLRIGFARINSGQETPGAVSLDSLYIRGLGVENYIYENRNNVSRVELPLHSGSDSTAFIISANSLIEFLPYVSDTVWLYYRRKPILISIECGFVTFFELESVSYSRYLIDTLTIDFTSITNNLDEHIKIFPYVADPEPQPAP